MNIYRTILPVTAIIISMFCACSPSSSDEWADTKPNEQSFTVVVESVGELFSGGEGVLQQAETKRPISSVTPTQTFDKLAVLIVEYTSPAKVVYKKVIDNWSSPDNKASIPWSTEQGQGRYATIKLTGSECLEEGKEYMTYVIGYQTGSYGEYKPFQGVDIGSYYLHTETATVPEKGFAEEVFAGAEVFVVENGVIMSKKSDEANVRHGLIVARRQVAGTFGYFTRIPVEVNGKKVAKIRLASTRQNRTVIFGGFRDVDDFYNFDKDNVINGTNPRTNYDCKLSGSIENNAFVVYDIELCKWFPGNRQDNMLPYDMNDDGVLDENDTNWTKDENKYPKGTISLPAGTIFGDKFLIAVAMTEADVAAGIPTFQMQMLDTAGEIIKSWDVALRDLSNSDTDGNRTLVSLPDGINGRTEISNIKDVDTETCFSIVRNRLYTMGEKNQSQTYGEDKPIDLSNADVLVLDVRHEWQIQNSIIFN